MDHFTYPRDAEIPFPVIPFLCDDCTEYDDLGLCNYPHRQGWATREEPLAWLFCDSAELARRAQVWLYFGTLSEFAGEHISPLSFRSPRGHLTTRALHDILKRQKHSYLSFRATPRLTATKSPDRLASILKEATRFSELLEQQLVDGTGILALISCSIRVLLQELGTAKYSIHQGNRPSTPVAPATGPRLVAYNKARWKVPAPRAIQHQMAIGGWCPAQIYFLAQKYSCRALFYLSGLRGDSSVSHNQCTSQRCTANSIDSSYRPKHIVDGCQCAQAGSTSAHIATIIRNGEIPVVSSSFSVTGAPELQIVPAEPGLKYVAISHVWSGGLGNPQGNTLPNCQLSKLMHNVKNLLSPSWRNIRYKHYTRSRQLIHFWLDTLCIPVDESDLDARQMAINSMAKIYSGAVQVLVLDVHLQKMRFNHLPVEEALARILSCSWMFRCWTLQEATLAQTCCVQFADNAVSLGTSSRDLRVPRLGAWTSNNSSHSAARISLLAELSRFLTDLEEVSWKRPGRATMWSYRAQERHQAHAFEATWNNFLGRFTTKMDDLHFMIAGMQDFKVSPVKEVPVRERMKPILKGHALLPLSMLYTPGERLDLDNPHLRWAPALPQGNELDCRLGYMKVFSDCLLVMNNASANTIDPRNMRRALNQTWLMTLSSIYRHLVLGKELQSLPLPYTCLVASPEAGLHDRFMLSMQNGSISEVLWIEACSLKDNEKSKPYAGPGEATKTCILLPNPSITSDRADWYQTQGARFYVRKEQDNSLHLAYDCPLRIYTYDRSITRNTMSGVESPSNRQAPSFKFVASSRVPSNHRILIDCDLSSWPSVPHFFSSPEEPLYLGATSTIYDLAYIMTQAIWLPSFILVLAGASLPQFHMHGHRLPLFYIYVGKIAFVVAEGMWRTTLIKNLERITWSEEFGSAPARDSHGYRSNESEPRPSEGRLPIYDILNQETSIIIGPKRAMILILLMVLFLVLGFAPNVLSRETRGWAQWTGVMIAVELVLRLLTHIAWLRLPETALGKWLRRRLIAPVWRWVRKKIVETARVYRKTEEEMERRPFRGEVDEQSENLYWGTG